MLVVFARNETMYTTVCVSMHNCTGILRIPHLADGRRLAMKYRADLNQTSNNSETTSPGCCDTIAKYVDASITGFANQFFQKEQAAQL